MFIHQVILELHNCFVYFDRNYLKCSKQSFNLFTGFIDVQKRCTIHLARLAHSAIHHQFLYKIVNLCTMWLNYGSIYCYIRPTANSKHETLNRIGLQLRQGRRQWAQIRPTLEQCWDTKLTQTTRSCPKIRSVSTYKNSVTVKADFILFYIFFILPHFAIYITACDDLR